MQVSADGFNCFVFCCCLYVPYLCVCCGVVLFVVYGSFRSDGVLVGCNDVLGVCVMESWLFVLMLRRLRNAVSNVFCSWMGSS